MSETDQHTIKGEILIVDDDPSSLQTLSDVLLEQGYGIRRARDAQTALMIIQNAPPDLILLDVRMPEMDGYELCQRLKSNEASCNIPVLFLSGLDETTDKIKGYKVGGVDYITKPFQVEEVLARVEAHLSLFKLQYQLEKQNEKLEYTIKERDTAQLKLQKSHDGLEQRVKERTTKLKEANLKLINEIAERKQIEETLKESGHRLRAEIEERERLHRELERSETMFRAFMDNIPASAYMKDKSYKLIYGNQFVLDYLGVRGEQFLGATSQDFFPPDIANIHEEADRKVLEEGKIVQSVPWETEIGGKTRWWSDFKFPVGLGTQECMVGGISFDVTDLKFSEQALNERFEYEKIISELSRIFVNLPIDQINQKINQGIDLIAKRLGIERVDLLQFSRDRSQLNLTHTYAIDPRQRAPIFLASEKLAWFSESLRRGRTLRISKISEMPKEAVAEKQYAKEKGFKSFLTIPMKVDESTIGAISYSSMTRERSWSDDLVQQFDLISEIFANALDRKQKEQKLRNAFSEIMQLKDRLQQENIYLREEVKLEHKHGEIIGKSNSIKYVLRQAEQVAQTKSTVLIQGETGTGKELLARRIHSLSSRKERALVTVNCSALPPGLIESELFGREKGAYTGALSKKLGRFEIADGSTIFLDEVGELPLELQAKLLRVLQDAKFERLGDTDTIEVDVRVIAATNLDLAKAVSEGSFREDLYYRLHVFPITIPPLRERQEDIPLLVWAFIEQLEKSMGKRVTTVQQSRMEEMLRYEWPGNVRELRNVVEQAMIVSKEDRTLNLRVPETATPEKIQDLSLDTVVRNHIITILEKTGWRVKGKNGAAELLSLHPATLFSRMKKLGIKRTSNSDDISSRR